MQEELRTFIESAKSAGASDSFLAALLEESGWPKKEIWLAFGDHYARVTGMAVPRRATGAESAKDAFFYLLAFNTLATWTWAVGSMMFTFINQWFPDAIYPNSYRATDYNVAFELASIFVAFPLYLYVMRLIVGQVEEHPEKLESDVRKWLRLREADRRRVQDLRAITAAINNRKSVPPTLRDIGIVSTDPVTKQPYEFRPTGGERFQVCATFSAKAENDLDTFWNHPAGRHCYEMLATVYH
jgi:Domain of unknown function (DUF5671)